MKKYLEFYKAFDKKLNGDLTSVLLLIVAVCITTTIMIMVDFNPEAPTFLIVILVFVLTILLMYVIYAIGLFVKRAFLWITEDVVSKFKETQEEFDYKPTDKAKVEFK